MKFYVISIVDVVRILQIQVIDVDDEMIHAVFLVQVEMPDTVQVVRVFIGVIGRC